MLVPAYAVTIHKSQGSEYPAVVIPVMTQHYAMLQRNLLYTGITRGKKLVVLVGQKKAVAIAARIVSGRRRWSKLGEWLAPASRGRGLLEASERPTNGAHDASRSPWKGAWCVLAPSGLVGQRPGLNRTSGLTTCLLLLIQRGRGPAGHACMRSLPVQRTRTSEPEGA
jgi:hypothetical protein